VSAGLPSIYCLQRQRSGRRRDSPLKPRPWHRAAGRAAANRQLHPSAGRALSHDIGSQARLDPCRPLVVPTKRKQGGVMKFFSVLALSAAAALASHGAHAQEYRFRFSADSATTNIKVQAYQKWADLAKEKSGGRIAIRVYPSAQLYNDVNVIPAVSSGTVDMGAPPSGLLTAVVPEAAVFELPSMWGITYDQYRRMLGGDFGRELGKKFEDKLGVKILGYYNMGAWVWGTTRKSSLIQAPADFADKKIRVVGNPLVEQTFKAMGAQPVQ